MVANQFQSHTGSDGSTADQRMQQAGYTGASSTGENAYAYANTVDEAMQAFLIDWGVSDSGHRRNLLQANVPTSGAFKDTGIGIASTAGNSKVGPMVITQDFGTQPNTPAQLVGVVYSDPNHTGMYQLNSGQGNVQIDATNLATGQTTSVQTWATGGYQLALAPGRYQVTASLNDTVIQTTQVTIGSDNVEQDFLVNGPWDGRTREQVLAAVTPQPAPTPVVPAPTPVAPVVAAPTPSLRPPRSPSPFQCPPALPPRLARGPRGKPTRSERPIRSSNTPQRGGPFSPPRFFTYVRLSSLTYNWPKTQACIHLTIRACMIPASLSQDCDSHPPPMWGLPMLPEEKSLPGSQLAASILDGERYGRLGQDRPDMGRHIVRAFEVVDEPGIAVRHQTSGKHFEIASHARVGVLADDQ